jgi:replicative DNA helicase
MNESILKKEKQFIHLLLKNKDLMSDYIESSLSPECFHLEHQNILRGIEDAYDKDVLLTRRSYAHFIQQLKSPRERISEETAFNSCLASVARVDDFPLLANSIFEAFLLRRTGEEVHSFEDNIKNRGVMPAFKGLVDNLQNLSLDSESSKGKSVYDEIGFLSKEHFVYKEKIRSGEIKTPPRVLCGIKEIDETMGTGLAPGTMTLVCADVGGFKSMMMMNLALNVWENGYNVLFIPIEMAKEQVFERIWSRQSGVLQEKIQKAEYDDEEKAKIDVAIRKFDESESKFYVMQMTGDTTVSVIDRQVKKYYDIFKPTLVVVDYIDNLETDKAKDRHDLEISDMLQKLRTMGRDLGFGVLSGAQIGRDALKRIRNAGSRKEGTAVNSEDIRGAHSFAMDSDYILAQVPNTAQPESLLDIFVVKARNGKKVFPNGHMKASLEIYPEIQLIKSVSDFDMSDEGVMEKITMFDDVGNQTQKTSEVDEMLGIGHPGVDDFGFEDF